jgi:hypothetical protein
MMCFIFPWWDMNMNNFLYGMWIWKFPAMGCEFEHFPEMGYESNTFPWWNMNNYDHFPWWNINKRNFFLWWDMYKTFFLWRYMNTMFSRDGIWIHDIYPWWEVWILLFLCANTFSCHGICPIIYSYTSIHFSRIPLFKRLKNWNYFYYYFKSNNINFIDLIFQFHYFLLLYFRVNSKILTGTIWNS